MTHFIVSHTLEYAFLGFCALIVVMQMVPAIMTGVGMVKGFVTQPTEVTAK
jgi:hypothetical protein